MDAGPRRWELRDFFAGIAEQAFEARLGVADPPLVDYLAGMLARFVQSDAIYGVRDLQGRRLALLADLLLEAENRIGDARRRIYRHIGDFTLFWAGVYPEAVDRLREPGHHNRITDFCAHGKRSYRIASQIPTADDTGSENDVLERLSDEFDLCVYGLGEVRREWERREGPDGGRIVVVV